MRCRLLGLTIAATLLIPAPGATQDLIFDSFREYLDSLRVQAGIPGLSVAVVGGDDILWEHAFGLRDVERAIPARTDTPFHLDGMTQVVTAVLLLRCLDEGRLSLDDPIDEYDPHSPHPNATIRELLTHTSSDLSGPRFAYDLERLEPLTAAVRNCSRARIHRATGWLFDGLGATDTAPGPDPAERFGPARTQRYGAVLDRLAAPYAVGGDGEAFASEHPATTLTAAGGLISSVRDLARFDIELRTGVLLQPATEALAWVAPAAPDGTPLPHGLGWFVQSYDGEPVGWQFGMSEHASSSLVVMAPTHGLTLIMLANSDGLAKPFDLASGDLTQSPFARVFLELFLR